MGGTSYPRDVYQSSSSGTFSSGTSSPRTTSSQVAKKALSQRTLDAAMNPHQRRIASSSESPIVIALDVTGSNSEFARIVYDKLPMFYGQIEQKKYLSDFEICFAAVGDANTDDAPLQVADFAKGVALDGWLKKIWLEGGGGGQEMETYEIAAQYFISNLDMQPKLPFCFFIADEAPYSMLDSSLVQNITGERISEIIDSRHVFTELFKKFMGNVFVLLNPYCGDETQEPANSQILNKWKTVLGPNAENIIRLKEEKSIVDVILGVIALKSGSQLNDYMKDLATRGQTFTRIANVRESLNSSRSLMSVKDAGGNLPVATNSVKRSSGSRRI